MVLRSPGPLIFGGLPRIKTDVKAAQPCTKEVQGQLLKKHPVSGEADLVDAGKAMELLGEIHLIYPRHSPG